LGPALSGFIYAAFGGPTAVYITCGVLGFSAAAAVLFISASGKTTESTKGSWQRLLAGIRYVKREKTLLGAISLDLFAVLLGGAVALLPVFARDILAVGPTGLGVMRSTPAIGAALMGLFLAAWP